MNTSCLELLNPSERQAVRLALLLQFVQRLDPTFILDTSTGCADLQQLLYAGRCFAAMPPSQAQAAELVLLCKVLDVLGESASEPASGAKIYRAFLTQSGSNPPVATIVENTLGAVPVWSRNDGGDYYLTLSGAFPAGKVAVRVDATNPSDPVALPMAQRLNDNIVWLLTWDDITTPTSDDGKLNGTFFEVVVLS